MASLPNLNSDLPSRDQRFEDEQRTGAFYAGGEKAGQTKRKRIEEEFARKDQDRSDDSGRSGRLRPGTGPLQVGPAAQIRPEHARDPHPAVGLLEVLQDRDEDARTGDG